MALLHLTVYLLLSCLDSLSEANSTQPRMTITEKETSIKRIPLPGHHAPVGIVLERQPDSVIAAGQTHLYAFHFQNPQKTPEEISVLWTECIDKGAPQRVKANCNYNITVVHKKLEDNQVFLCGTNGQETVCCDMEDRGGIKNHLRYSWTSQMNARLFCGDPDSRQHFSELVDVATVHADQWQNTRVYALFRNEWGMSAVCVYTIQDIENIFTTSTFKGKDNQPGRPRQCVADSTKIPLDALKMIIENSEMEEWVRPVNNSGPLLFNHHSYTHIYVDSSQNNHPTVLFLSLNNGGIHKVMESKSQTFVIAEYRPFNHGAQVLHMVLHASSRKLYVNSRSELVQLDVANCAQYGNSCGDCVLARDPYCGWNGTHCTPGGELQDVTQGDYSICVSTSKLQQPGKAFRYSTDTHADEAKGSITLPPESKYFLQCPVSSHHAQYTWRHHESNTSCSSMKQQCLLLIDSMGAEQVGTYTCVSEEKGYSRVLAQYQLRLGSTAVGRSSSPLVWLCLMAVLIQSVAD
ncbi:semaphorin-7A isoform X3 [Perca flavescens]|uniref:semaphorin-7A isoform X3 n=1 Tax=Perca flavescens TaxID=8167 RepID=UPI00106E3574|nr:semaphorin-7A-like isoform X3 [Perca flavescens]